MTCADKFLQRREILGIRPDSFVDEQIRKSDGKFFRKNLVSHYGCVNALEFSQDGSLLASGGDDRRVMLWNVQKAITGNTTPTIFQAKHRSNVFALAFDNCGEKIISAGNDAYVILHDIATERPVDYFLQEQPVFGLTASPIDRNVFSVAGDDGRLLVYDIRENATTEPLCLAKTHSAFHSIMFHPLEPRIILSGNSKEGANLHDIRMPKKTLLKFGGDICCMDARFSQDGSKILALRRRLPPVLYDARSSAHLFQFNNPSYYNSCTMKTCCFGGTRDQFVISGSDNFDLHIWEIPSEGTNKWVNEATFVLKGHRSIVNQVRYNYSHHIIVSSGVEKIIKVWSPFSVGPESCWLNDEPRTIFKHEEYVSLYMRTGQGHFFAMNQLQNQQRTTAEDTRMLAFFDALVQRDLAGLSDEDSDVDSTYTNTVYSTHASSSDEDDAESNTSQIEENDSNSNENYPISNHSGDENEPELVDIDDLPIVDSSSDSEGEMGPFPAPIGNVHTRGIIEDEDLFMSPSSTPELVAGSSEPATLSNLIVTKNSQLRKLASKKDSVNTASTVRKIMSSSSSSSSSEESENEETKNRNSKRKQRKRPRNLQSTPIYDRANNSIGLGSDDTPGSSHQLVNNLMTRSLVDPPALSSSSSSSNSLSSSSDGELEETSNRLLPSNKTLRVTEGQKSKQSMDGNTELAATPKKVIKSSDPSMLSSKSETNDTPKRKRRRSSKASNVSAIDSSDTRDDSGIDVCKWDLQDTAIQRSLTNRNVNDNENDQQSDSD